MSKILSRRQLTAMIAKAQEKCEAQVYQHLGEFTVIVYCSGSDLLLLCQPLSEIVNLHGAWKSLINAWPYQMTDRAFLTKSNPPSLCAKFKPPFIVKRKPGPEKTSELVSVHLEVIPEMLADLKQASKKEMITVNEIIREAIEGWLESEKFSPVVNHPKNAPHNP